MKTNLMTVAFAIVAGSAGATHAAQTIVNFDSLTGTGLVPDGYGGVLWNQNWTYYDSFPGPFTIPHSPPTRVYTNYEMNPVGELSDVSFSFASTKVFEGAFFTGGPIFQGITFKLYNGGNLVHTSATLIQTPTSTFLASGYGGLVDEVRVSGYNGYYTMDDVTYSTGVPEPATWAMMLLGFFGMGSAARRLRSRQPSNARRA